MRPHEGQVNAATEGARIGRIPVVDPCRYTKQYLQLMPLCSTFYTCVAAVYVESGV